MFKNFEKGMQECISWTIYYNINSQLMTRSLVVLVALEQLSFTIQKYQHQQETYLSSIVNYFSFREIYAQAKFTWICIIVHLLVYVLIFINVTLKIDVLKKILACLLSRYSYIHLLLASLYSSDFMLPSIFLLIITTFTGILNLWLFKDLGFNRQQGISGINLYTVLRVLLINALVICYPFGNTVESMIVALMILIAFLETLQYQQFTANIYHFQITFLIIQAAFLAFSYSTFFFYAFFMIIPVKLYLIQIAIQISKLFPYDNLEQLHLAAQNQSEKLVALHYLSEHRKNCPFIKCACQLPLTLGGEVNMEIVNQLIISLIRKQTIKYISFLEIHNQNDYFNYGEFLSIYSDVYDYYTKNIIQLFGRKIKLRIDKSSMTNSRTIIRSLNVLTTQSIKIKTSLQSLITSKLQLWSSYSNNRIDNLQILEDHIENVNDSANRARLMLAHIKILIDRAIQCNAARYSVFFLRLQLIVQFLSTNHVTSLKQFQEQIKDILKEEKISDFVVRSNSYKNNNAVQLLAIISKNNQGWIKSVSNKFLGLAETSHINTMIPKFLVPIHDGILDRFCAMGPSRESFFESFIEINGYLQKTIISTQLTFLPIDISQDLLCLATITRDQNNDVHYILLDENFTMRGASQTIYQNISEKQLQMLKMNIGKMIPSFFTQVLTYYHEKYSKGELEFQIDTLLVDQIEDFLIIDAQVYDEMNTVIYSHVFDAHERLKTTRQYAKLSKVDVGDHLVYKVRYSVTQKIIKYLRKGELEYFLYYVVKLQMSDEIKQEKSQEDEEETVIHEMHDQDVNQSIHSVQTNATFKTSIELLHLRIKAHKLIPSLKYHILLSFLFVCYFIAFIAVIYVFFSQKKDLQSQCFNKLSYTTEYLDGYTRAVMASRHVIYRRDYNAFLSQSVPFQVGGISINTTNVDRISFGLQIYQLAIKYLLNNYVTQYDKLALYQSPTNITYYRINFNYTQSEIEILETQAQYYIAMISIFYIAIKSFASSPALYLAGTTDTYAQVSTRSILYFNLKGLTGITKTLMQQCQTDNAQQNQVIDNTFYMVMISGYIILAAFTIIFILIHLLITKQRKSILKLFSRIEYQEAVDEIHKIQTLQQNLKDENFLILDVFNSAIEEYKQQKTSTNFKKITQLQSKISVKSSLSFKWQFATIILVSVLVLIFIVLFHIQYISYSKELDPIVKAALKTLYIRLNFVSVMNDWDVFVTNKFYIAMIAIQSQNPQGAYRIFSENIRHGQILYSFMNITEDELQSQIAWLQQEPFSSLIYSQSSGSENDETLLQKDICTLAQFNCDLNTTVFQGRVYTSELQSLFKVGIINLWKSTSSVILQNDFFSTNDSQTIINQFQSLEYSFSYFTYFLWGFDATIYQIKLFSDYFIQLSENTLTNLTFKIQSQILAIGLILLFTNSIILLIFNKSTINKYVQTRRCLKLLPYQFILNKQIPQALKRIDDVNNNCI